MPKFIKKLHEKPKHTRQMIAFLGALVITALLVVGWGFSLGDRFSPESKADQSEGQKPFAVLREMFSRSAKDFREANQERKETIRELNTEPQVTEETPQTLEEIDDYIDEIYSDEGTQ